MKQDKLLSLIGLAKRAGQCAHGEFRTEEAVKSGEACLVILAQDASGNTKKKFQNMCGYYETQVLTAYTKEELGHAAGRELLAVLAITDEGLARSILKVHGNR